MYIKALATESLQQVFEEHEKAGCDPSRYADRKRTVPICPVKGCKTKLTATKKIECASCSVTVCLKHRFEDAHSCSRRKPSKSVLVNPQVLEEQKSPPMP